MIVRGIETNGEFQGTDFFPYVSTLNTKADHFSLTNALRNEIGLDINIAQRSQTPG